MKILISTANYYSNKDTIDLLKNLNEINGNDPLLELHVQVFDNSSSLVIDEEFTNIKYSIIKPRFNLGLAPTWKISIGFAQKNDYDAVVLVNNDTEFSNDFFDVVEENIKTDPISIYSPYIQLQDLSPWSTGGDFGLFPWIVKHYAYPKEIIKTARMETEHVSGCCIVLPKGVIQLADKKLKGLSDFFFRGEEWFLNLTFSQLKIKKIILRDAVLTHKENGSHSRFSQQHIYWAIRAKCLFIKKLRGINKSLSLLTYFIHIFTKGLMFYKSRSELSYTVIVKEIYLALKDGATKSVIRASDYKKITCKGK